MLLELALGLREPPASTTTRVGDPLRVEHKLRSWRALRLLGFGPHAGLLDPLRTFTLIVAKGLPGPTQELAPALRRAQRLGQLITTRLAELPILGLVGRRGLGHDLLGNLPELQVHIRVGATSDPGAIDRHHPRLDQPRLVAQPQHVSEQLRQRPPVPADEPRHRHMIRNQVPSDHPKSNMLPAMTLDRARGTHPGRERIQAQAINKGSYAARP
jgi:hypothetical protein